MARWRWAETRSSIGLLYLLHLSTAGFDARRERHWLWHCDTPAMCKDNSWHTYTHTYIRPGCYIPYNVYQHRTIWQPCAPPAKPDKNIIYDNGNDDMNIFFHHFFFYEIPDFYWKSRVIYSHIQIFFFISQILIKKKKKMYVFISPHPPCKKPNNFFLCMFNLKMEIILRDIFLFLLFFFL